jgi:hypothetical protein
MLFAEFGTGQVFWSMLWFFLFFIWIWLLMALFADIFRIEDLSGWGKALWTIFIICLPFLGILVYLIARGSKMQDRAVRDAARQEADFQTYVREVASSGEGGVADEVAKFADLKARGVISETEFEQAKAKVLA